MPAISAIIRHCKTPMKAISVQTKTEAGPSSAAIGPSVVATSSEPPSEMTNEDFQVTARVRVFLSSAETAGAGAGMAPGMVLTVFLLCARRRGRKSVHRPASQHRASEGTEDEAPSVGAVMDQTEA